MQLYVITGQKNKTMNTKPTWKNTLNIDNGVPGATIHETMYAAMSVGYTYFTYTKFNITEVFTYSKDPIRGAQIKTTEYTVDDVNRNTVLELSGE